MYMQKNEIFLNFVTKLACFGGIEGVFIVAISP